LRSRSSRQILTQRSSSVAAVQYYDTHHLVFEPAPYQLLSGIKATYNSHRPSKDFPRLLHSPSQPLPLPRNAEFIINLCIFFLQVWICHSHIVTTVICDLLRQVRQLPEHVIGYQADHLLHLVLLVEILHAF
jgi:hypothetical protein